MVRTLATSLAVAALWAGPAVAQAPAGACQSLIEQVRVATGNRLDYSANRARDKMMEAERLLKDNKSAECMVKMQEAANDIQLTVR